MLKNKKKSYQKNIYILFICITIVISMIFLSLYRKTYNHKEIYDPQIQSFNTKIQINKNEDTEKKYNPEIIKQEIKKAKKELQKRNTEILHTGQSLIKDDEIKKIETKLQELKKKLKK